MTMTLGRKNTSFLCELGSFPLFALSSFHFSVSNGKNNGPLAVVVFVHGEDFAYGAGHPYDPSMFVSQMNVIVVTMNYRVGILGKFFLSLLIKSNFL